MNDLVEWGRNWLEWNCPEWGGGRMAFSANGWLCQHDVILPPQDLFNAQRKSFYYEIPFQNIKTEYQYSVTRTMKLITSSCTEFRGNKMLLEVLCPIIDGQSI